MSFFSNLFNKISKNNHPSSKRSYDRFGSTALSIKIDNHTYYAKDASIGGVNLKSCHEGYPNGLMLNISIILIIHHIKKKLTAKAMVLRNDCNGLILQFKKIPPDTKSIYDGYINLNKLDFS